MGPDDRQTLPRGSTASGSMPPGSMPPAAAVPSGRPSSADPDAMRQRYVDRIHLWMGVAATFVLMPFAVYNAIQGRFAVSSAMVGISALFGANLVAVLRSRTPPVPVVAIYMVALGAITLSTFTFVGLQGVVWAYPSVVLFHFMAGGRQANVLNTILALVAAVLTFEVVGLPMAIRVGATLGLTIAFTNIFSRALEAANRAIDEARTQAERANLAKSQFLANMSHELRTPLNAIIGYTEMLHEDAEAEGRETTVKDLARIAGASRHLLQMIDEILDLARIEASRVELSFTPVVVPSFVEELADAARSLARKNANQLSVQLVGDADTLALQADVTRLRQCMLNLLSNACKFTEKGHVTLRVERAELDGVPGVAFEVQDTGIGMNDEQLARVFQPFEQADASTTRRFGGTGLGLAITSQLVRLMGGTVSAKSAPGQGSTFTLTVPLAPPVAR
jgi:signal transduction histidine kinase